MKNYLITLIGISILIITSCTNDDSTIDMTLTDDCNILESLEEINELIAECHENLFSSTNEIENDLIGEWTLRGIIPGWTAYEPTSECLILSINDDSLTLKDLNTGEESSSTWEIKSYDINNNLVFYLEPTDEDLRWSVGMQFFSKNIMYGAGFADDTDTYVYEK